MAEYIEREAAIAKNHGGVVYIDDIKEIPAADVAPVRHGRWIVVKVPNEWDKGQCSECKSIFNSSVWGAKYCPNCGAKMDGGEPDA